jgi:hypothetical protein
METSGDILDMRGYAMTLLFQKKPLQKTLRQENQSTMSFTPLEKFSDRKGVSSQYFHNFFIGPSQVFRILNS